MKRWKSIAVGLVVVGLLGSGYWHYNSRSPMPKCQISDWYKKSQVTSEEREALTKYFSKKNLLPIMLHDAWKADRRIMSEGWHECVNKGLPNGGYAGFIPANAYEGFAIGVTHKRDIYGSFNYMQLARINGKLVVVGGGTSL